MWNHYCRSLKRAITRAGAKAKDPKWYWSPWSAFQAGYRAAKREGCAKCGHVRFTQTR